MKFRSISYPLIVLVSVMGSSCSDPVEPDPLQPLYGYYDLSIDYADNFYWGIGYKLKHKQQIGKIEKFIGYEGNMIDLDNKIGISIDTADFSLITSKSFCKWYSDTLLFRYLNYYHPTINKDGNLTYDEINCSLEFPVSHFEGFLRNDTLHFFVTVADTTGGFNYTITGIKINQ